MAQSLSVILVHLVFSTKSRRPLIRPEIEPELHAYLAGVCRDLNCPTLAVNGVEDHVHLLVRLGKKVTLAELIEAVKKRSSKWIKTKGPEYADFYWQAGYGAFSIGQSNADALKQYIGSERAS